MKILKITKIFTFLNFDVLIWKVNKLLALWQPICVPNLRTIHQVPFHYMVGSRQQVSDRDHIMSGHPCVNCYFFLVNSIAWHSFALYKQFQSLLTVIYWPLPNSHQPCTDEPRKYETFYFFYFLSIHQNLSFSLYENAPSTIVSHKSPQISWFKLLINLLSLVNFHWPRNRFLKDTSAVSKNQVNVACCHHIVT